MERAGREDVQGFGTVETSGRGRVVRGFRKADRHVVGERLYKVSGRWRGVVGERLYEVSGRWRRVAGERLYEVSGRWRGCTRFQEVGEGWKEKGTSFQEGGEGW